MCASDAEALADHRTSMYDAFTETYLICTQPIAPPAQRLLPPAPLPAKWGRNENRGLHANPNRLSGHFVWTKARLSGQTRVCLDKRAPAVPRICLDKLSRHKSPLPPQRVCPDKVDDI